MVIPDVYVDHGAHEWQLEQAGLSSGHIAATALTLVGRQRESLDVLAAAAQEKAAAKAKAA